MGPYVLRGTGLRHADIWLFGLTWRHGVIVCKRYGSADSQGPVHVQGYRVLYAVSIHHEINQSLSELHNILCARITASAVASCTRGGGSANLGQRARIPVGTRAWPTRATTCASTISFGFRSKAFGRSARSLRNGRHCVGSSFARRLAVPVSRGLRSDRTARFRESMTC